MDANQKIMSLIPIVNSDETGRVDENTKEIFIEVKGGNDLNSCKAALSTSSSAAHSQIWEEPYTRST